MKPIPENDMYRSTVLKESVDATHPHSKLGMVSCGCSVVAWLLLVVLALKHEWVFMLGWSNGVLALIFMLALLGMLLGLMCVFQLQVRKVFGKLGLLLGSLCAMCIGVLWWLAVNVGV
ncbi:MAG: hypothetical protein KA221_09605 [Vitreoscilla sp.]|nr:hypothetical protein [Vitreoscilla sp.]MBP9540470.1 hypothetical protein [Vitreoscilla sp.]